MWYNYIYNRGGGNVNESVKKNVIVKNKRMKRKAKIRMLLGFLIFGSIIATLSYNLINNVNKINQMKKEKVFLEEQILALQEEEKVLKNDIQKLEDPSYVARYAREKYLYSKEGEYIIRIPE